MTNSKAKGACIAVSNYQAEFTLHAHMFLHIFTDSEIGWWQNSVSA